MLVCQRVSRLSGYFIGKLNVRSIERAFFTACWQVHAFNRNNVILIFKSCEKAAVTDILTQYSFRLICCYSKHITVLSVKSFSYVGSSLKFNGFAAAAVLHGRRLNCSLSCFMVMKLKGNAFALVMCVFQSEKLRQIYAEHIKIKFCCLITQDFLIICC